MQNCLILNKLQLTNYMFCQIKEINYFSPYQATYCILLEETFMLNILTFEETFILNISTLITTYIDLSEEIQVSVHSSCDLMVFH